MDKADSDKKLKKNELRIKIINTNCNENEFDYDYNRFNMQQVNQKSIMHSKKERNYTDDPKISANILLKVRNSQNAKVMNKEHCN